MTALIFSHGATEPDRSWILRDDDGDSWWYNHDRGGWQFSGDPTNVGTNYFTGVRTWEQAIQETQWIPFRYAGQFIGEKIVWNDRPIQPGEGISFAPAEEFVVKDSGAREEYANGFVRDTEDGKYDYARILRIEGLHLIPVEALERWGAHMLKGAEKYGEDNWRQAKGPIAIARFLRSLCRHVVQYIRKDRTEDHAAAVCFNVWAAELTPEEE